MMIIKFLSFSALFFYVLCWFSDQQSKTLWYLGIALPWLSLIMSIFIYLFVKSEKDNTGTYWAYTYITITIIYVVVLAIISGNIWHQVPHIAACTTFIASVCFERLQNKYEEENKKATILKEKCNTQSYHIKSLQAEQTEVKKRLSDIVSEQSKYDDYTDEVIVLARSKVMSKFCRELLKDISEYQKMDKELYS